jgi:hypothetical protein
MRCYGRHRQVRELPAWTLEAKDSLTDRLQAESVSLAALGGTINHLAGRYLTDYIEPIARGGRRWKLVFFVLQGPTKLQRGQVSCNFTETRCPLENQRGRARRFVAAR